MDESGNEKENGIDENKEGNGLNKDKCEIKGARYVPPSFILLFLFAQKIPNRLLDLGKEKRGLNHLVYISKICYSRVLTLH